MYGTELKPSDIVIFGGTGDLSLRKILPALYYRLADNQLPKESRIIVLGRAERSREDHKEQVKKAFDAFLKKEDFNVAAFDALMSHVHYVSLDANNIEHFHKLTKVLDAGSNEVRVFYLATPAEIYGAICENLSLAGAITPTSRVVLEKPIGYGLDSFTTINTLVCKYFTEHQIYRIDHYLGKETVQNLMVLRFTNNVFQRVWTGDVIDHVQITVAESTGLEDRHDYYDGAGALRDMVQNHLLQLVCLIAMEPPNQITPNAIRDEKMKVLRALRPFNKDSILTHTVRGQYGAGQIGEKKIRAYRDEAKKPQSDTETFVAIKASIDNWRWNDIPFYLRTGKSLKERYSEIVVHFKPVPHDIFLDQDVTQFANKLVIRLQPDEYVKFQMNTKVPGPGGYRVKPVNLNLSLAEEFEERVPEAYERLLMDVVRGNQTLFMRCDEVEAAWNWVETILGSWKEAKMQVDIYEAGSKGPEAANRLMRRDNREWH
jgi:glucose-6-phosphate 1-dehydrogenase